MKSKKRVIFATPTPSVLTEQARAAGLHELAKNPSIPVLTDILHSPEKKRMPATAKTASPVTTALEKLPWDEIEERLTLRIRNQVMERMDFVLDENIMQHVSTVLQQMASMLAEEIKHDMQNTLDVIVTHTVSAELQQLKQKQRQLENNTPPPKRDRNDSVT